MKKEFPDTPGDLFHGSIALIGVCLVVITLFQVTDKNAVYTVDECLSFSVALLLGSVLLSYTSILRPEKRWFRRSSHTLFLAAFVSIVGSFLVLLYEFHSHA